MSDQRILRSNKPQIPNPYNTVGEYVWKKLQDINDQFICLINARTDERLTIGSLKAQANSIAVALLNRGVTKTDVIAFSGSNTIEHTILKLVAYFIGLTSMPLNPTFAKYEVQEECKLVHANLIFSSAKDLHKFSGITKDNHYNVKLVVVFDGKSDQFVTFAQLLEEGRGQLLKRIPHFDVNPEEDMLYLIHTSGSTGRPKCAMIPHNSFLLRVGDYLQLSGISKGSMVITSMTFGHNAGSNFVLAVISSGATALLMDNLSEELLLKSIEKYRVNCLPIRPNTGLVFIEGDLADKYDLSSLKVLSSGAAAFPENIARALIDKYGIELRECYGLTECALVCAGCEPGEEYIPGNNGRLLYGLEVKVIDLNTGQSLGPNIDGEIYVRGNNLFRGYLKEDGKVYAFDSEGWFRTGDLGHYDEEERIFITDRIKEAIRVFIENVYSNISPVEIELFLLTHKSIAEVAVVGINDKNGGQWPRAYVVLKKGQTSTAQEIQNFISDTLAVTKQLRGGVIFVDSIQRTALLKVDRKFYRNLVKNEIIDGLANEQDNLL